MCRRPTFLPLLALPLAAPGPLALAACAAPGAEIAPVEGEFAFLEIRLQG